MDGKGQPCSGVAGTWLLLLDYGLRINQRHVIQTRDTITENQVHRRDGRVGAVTLVREASPHGLVHGMEILRTVHEREGGDVGQVSLDQFCIGGLQLGRVGLSGDRLDQLVDLWVRVLAQLPFQLFAAPTNSELSRWRMRPQGWVGPAPSLHIMKIS